MSDINDNTEGRVAVLVDCDNTSPEIPEYALRVVAQFGRVVDASLGRVGRQQGDGSDQAPRSALDGVGGAGLGFASKASSASAMSEVFFPEAY